MKHKYRKPKKIEPADQDYGPKSNPDPDMDEQILLEKKKEILIKLQLKEEEIVKLEVETRGQSTNCKWLEERAHRLTASYFGRVCKMRLTTSCENIVNDILYKQFLGNHKTKYGIDHEPYALLQFEKGYNLKIEKCGLIIDKEFGFLGASPDGLIGQDALVEVKCPFNSCGIHPLEAISRKKNTFATVDENNKLKLKRNHNYFYQVQGQLQIAKRKICYFIVWSKEGMLVEEIDRDDNFWNMNMKGPLTVFYLNCLLPEIIDARHPRNLAIRNPKRLCPL